MAKFNRWDKVKVSKPLDTTEGPHWVMGMDEYDGKTMVVDGKAGRWWSLQNCHFTFDERWLTKANTFKGNV